MRMCRVVMRDGSQLHVEANVIGVEQGCLKLYKRKNEGDSLAPVAFFARGVWRYYLIVVLDIKPKE